MRFHLYAFVVAALVLLGLDVVWLSTMADAFYRPQLGAMLRPDFILAPAAVFYVLYVTGIVLFAVAPSRTAGAALGRGGFLGLVAYGTYDLTNYATLAGWPVDVVIVDMIWGTFLTASAAMAGFVVANRLVRR